MKPGSLLHAGRDLRHVPHKYQGIIFTGLVAPTAEHREAFLGNGTDGIELLQVPEKIALRGQGFGPCLGKRWRLAALD